VQTSSLRVMALICVERYRQSSKLWECGNREAISKGGEKGGKPDFGFPGFPRTVISRAWPVSLRLGSLLLFFRGSAEAIGFCARLQDVSSIGDSIQQRFAESRVGDDLRPLGNCLEQWKRRPCCEAASGCDTTHPRRLAGTLEDDFGG
jgi:hypothetical protein